MAEVAQRIRKISLEDAKKSYEELKEFVPGSQPSLTREGTKALDYFFFRHRLAAKTKRHVSFLNILKNSAKYKELKAKTRKIKKYNALSKPKPADIQFRNQYDVFQLYYGTINQFRPTVAKWLYSKLQPRFGILDFSSGWGGRALAAMSMGIPYYGFDANKKLESSYKAMIKTMEPAADIQMRFQPSETADFSQLKYDLVFTSPPYFMLEEYEGMPAYEQEQGFLDLFFVPVVAAAWQHLQPGGFLALNMPESMYKPIKNCLPPLYKTFKMPLMDRHPGEAARGNTLKKGKTQRHELIYVWHKEKKSVHFDKEAKRCGIAV
jgi:hypothetical protein